MAAVMRDAGPSPRTVVHTPCSPHQTDDAPTVLGGNEFQSTIGLQKSGSDYCIPDRITPARIPGYLLPPTLIFRVKSRILKVTIPPTVEVGPYSPYVTTYRRTVTLTCAVSGAKPNISSLHWEKDGARVETIGFTDLQGAALGSETVFPWQNSLSSKTVPPRYNSRRSSKKNNAAPYKSAKGKYSGGNMASPSLLIHHVTRADTGAYACIADHVVRPAASSLRLEVLYPASIISVSESLSVDQSERATLQCVADGNPTPNITWTKEGARLRTVTQPLSSDVLACSVVFLNVQVNDSGTYECLASNGVGEADRRIAKLTVRETNADDRNYIWAIMVGAIAGGLWILVCSGLTLYILKRRRDRREKKKYAFYYNMGKQEDAKETLGPPTVELPEYLTKTEETVENLYAKPIKNNYSGIETMRKTAHKKGKCSPSRIDLTVGSRARSGSVLHHGGVLPQGCRSRRFAKAVYSYSAMEENELHLEIDDVIEVLEGEDGGWCLGYLRGRIGLFPSNYVTFLPAGEASKMTEDLYPNLDSVRSTPCRQSRRKATTPEKTGASREMGQLKKIDCVEI
ncbi:hypothetical protein Bbelb_339820 [Branchiostoma belcheri]|nr:hypothetical protein Bbelb_339820 [Branchiostoma belcheri]